MISSISSSQTTLERVSEDSSTTNAKESVQAGSVKKASTQQDNSEEVSTSKDGDTLEISEEAKAKYAAQSTQNTGSAAAAQSTMTVSEEDDEEDTDTESSTAQLSQYTTQELKEMLDSGEITQAEYNNEIKRREESESGTGEENVLENIDLEDESEM